MTKLAGDRLCDVAKILGYLLDPTHPDGAAKEAFFRRFGFEVSRPAVMLEALLDHPARNLVVAERSNTFGVLSEVRCRLETPDGRNPCIRTIWMLEHGSSVHRFVTAYPVDEL